MDAAVATDQLTLACALAVEEDAARSGNARAARVGLQAGLPLVSLMIGYTILSLCIIAQPIVVEPV